MNCVIIQINANFLVSQKINCFFYIIDLTFILYLKNFLLLSVVEAFKAIHFFPQFFPQFYKFGEWLRCVIYRIYTTFLICQPNIDIFMQKSQYPCLSFPKRFGALHCKSFRKRLLVPTFLLLFDI